MFSRGMSGVHQQVRGTDPVRGGLATTRVSPCPLDLGEIGGAGGRGKRTGSGRRGGHEIYSDRGHGRTAHTSELELAYGLRDFLIIRLVRSPRISRCADYLKLMPAPGLMRLRYAAPSAPRTTRPDDVCRQQPFGPCCGGIDAVRARSLVHHVSPQRLLPTVDVRGCTDSTRTLHGWNGRYGPTIRSA